MKGSWEEGSASGCISKKNRAATAHGGRRCGGATDCSVAQRATVPVGDDGVRFSLAKGVAAGGRERGYSMVSRTSWAHAPSTAGASEEAPQFLLTKLPRLALLSPHSSPTTPLYLIRGKQGSGSLESGQAVRMASLTEQVKKDELLRTAVGFGLQLCQQICGASICFNELQPVTKKALAYL
ncbi:hypothetical protein ZEAMMB73_Zm00001d029755 [Zea mays]|uniref:Uncharacterized protein n=1 Tax=Zea mays TaxID=4577 RepID=A0A1D6K7L5_MAIZE|nr:hypothetical protein ZEAMMB73_Zm00001d029755 [Zea mays]